jgi:hypothetical protein
MIQLSLIIAIFIVVKFVQIIYGKDEEQVTKGFAVAGAIAVIILCIFMVDGTGEFTKFLK